MFKRFTLHDFICAVYNKYTNIMRLTFCIYMYMHMDNVLLLSSQLL